MDDTPFIYLLMKMSTDVKNIADNYKADNNIVK